MLYSRDYDSKLSFGSNKARQDHSLTLEIIAITTFENIFSNFLSCSVCCCCCCSCFAFVLFSCFVEIVSYYISLEVLEYTIYANLAWNSEKLTCLPSAYTKGST